MQIKLAITLALGATVPLMSMGQDGMLDGRFGDAGVRHFSPDGTTSRSIAFNAVRALPDGSLVAAGFIDQSLPIPLSEPNYRVVIAKLHADGSPDVNFGSTRTLPGLLVLDNLRVGARIQEARSIALMADGSIVVAGALDAWMFGGFTLKISPDGTLDAAYGVGGIALLPFQALDVAVDSAERIVVAGRARGEVPMSRGIVARVLGANGMLDTTFGDGGSVELVERRADGSVIDHQGHFASISVTADDRIVAAGSQEQDGANFAYSIAKFDDQGLDASFAGDGWLKFAPTWAPSTINSIARVLLDESGRILIAGDYKGEGGRTYPVLGRLSGDGVPDADFGSEDSPGFAPLDDTTGFEFDYQAPTALAQQADGRIVFTATASAGSQPPAFVAARTDITGKLDHDFGEQGISIVETDPLNLVAETTGLTLQGGQPVMVGVERYLSNDDASLVRATVMRLVADAIFADGFDETTSLPKDATHAH